METGGKQVFPPVGESGDSRNSSWYCYAAKPGAGRLDIIGFECFGCTETTHAPHSESPLHLPVHPQKPPVLAPERERKSLKSAKQIFVQPLVIPLPFIYAKFHLLFIFHAWASARKQNTKKNIFGFRVGTIRLAFCAERKSRRSWGEACYVTGRLSCPLHRSTFIKRSPRLFQGPLGPFGTSEKFFRLTDTSYSVIRL